MAHIATECERLGVHRVSSNVCEPGVSMARIATECEPLGVHRVSSNVCEPVLVPWFAPNVNSDRTGSDRCEPWNQNHGKPVIQDHNENENTDLLRGVLSSQPAEGFHSLGE